MDNKMSFSESIPLEASPSIGVFNESVMSLHPPPDNFMESSTLAPDFNEVNESEGQKFINKVSPEVSKEFALYIEQLHKESGREERREPRVGRKDLDLLLLYLAVERRGGYTAITEWKELGEDLALPQTVTNSGYILRTKYEQFLLPFEKELSERYPVDEKTGQLIENKIEGEWIQHYGPQNEQYQENPFDSLSYFAHVPDEIKTGVPRPGASKLTRLSILEFPFTAESLEELLGRNPNLQELEAGTLRNLKRAPQAEFFPENLRKLTLEDVPQAIAAELMTIVMSLNLESVNINVEKMPQKVENAMENRIEKYSFFPSSLD